jgi:predicted MFS family arabinose efflux permease
MPTFSRYQKQVVAIIAFLQFTIILDFMILSPLGAFLLRDMHLQTSQFGSVVSAYAFSAGISGLLTAGFADKFDRKKLLLFFYAGFVLGTFLCAIATSYKFLLIARVVTGLFGGVIGSIGFAIITDLFPMEVRGRVMGIVMTAFSAAQVLGLPVGLILANTFSWHAPFVLIGGVSLAVGFVIVSVLKPVDAHLKIASTRNPLVHLGRTAVKGRYVQTFLATMLMTTGGFMLMPFGSAFSVHNLGLDLKTQVPIIYFVTGITSAVAGPLVGRLSDGIGKYKMFCVGTVLGMIIVGIYCNLGQTPLGWILPLNALLFVAITARMISASALTSGVPEPQDRGAFMSINQSGSQFAGGVAAQVAGLIVVQAPDGKLLHYGVLGYVVMSAMFVTIVMLYPIHRMVHEKLARRPQQPAAVPAAPPPAPAEAEAAAP